MEYSPLNNPSLEDRETYSPSDIERQFITDAYESFWQCYSIRQEPLKILGNRTLESFWNDSERDYSVVLDELEEENDPVKRYQTTISRDKTNVFVAHIAGSLMYPDVIAQNTEQSIDRVWSRVGTSMLYWAHRQDGWPAENGQQKAERIAHTSTVKGTAFSLDIVTKDGLESEEIPVEELFISTFWQPNIQKHPVVFRAKINVTYEEAEAMFGHLDNFKYVGPGESWLDDTFIASNALKTAYQGIVKEQKVSVLYVWKTARPKELEKMKAERKVWSSATRGTFYNVLINGVPMFPVDNASPYKHGFLPVSKCIFELLRSDFFYGNSVPNKMREDKKWKDDWKTLMRFKGKLGALPPQLIIGGHIDEQIILPSAQTSVPEGVEVQQVPGITGITNSDIELMNMADSEIDRSSVSPSTAGQRPETKQTARAEVIQASAAQKMLEPFTRQYGYFMQSRSFPILLSLLQFVSRRSIKRIVVPDQTLADGAKGSFEIIFKDTSELSAMEKLSKSFEIKGEEDVSRERGEPKDVAYISPSYIRDMRFFLFSDVAAGLEDKNIIRQQEFANDLKNIFLARPDLVDVKVALREFVRMKGYSEKILLSGTQPQPQGLPGRGEGVGAEQVAGPTEGDAVTNAAALEATGQKLPALPA